MAGWKLRKDKTQGEASDEASPAPTALTETTPENHAPSAELPDDLLPLPSLTHWEMPAEEWTPPAAPVIAESVTEEPAAPEPILSTPVEDEPVFTQEKPREVLSFAEAETEEIHYRFAPLDLGASEITDTAPHFDTEDEEEDSEPAPHFEDDEELPGQAIELIEVAPPLPPAESEALADPEPEIVPESEMVAALEPVIVPIAEPKAAVEPKAVAEPKKRKAVARSSAASEPVVIPAPEPEVIAASEPEIVPEPEIVAPAPELEVEAATEPQVLTAPPVMQEPEDVAAPVPAAAPEPPLFPMPSPTPPEIAISTMRLARTDLASAVPPPSGFSVPPVSPFLLDIPKAPVQEAPHTLLVRIGRLSATFEMTKEVTVIGRPDSELHFYPDIEIEMDDAVSRRHAEILRHEDEYYLVDAGSTNGTLLNGETLTPHEERKLAHGDRIRVGERTEIIFE